MAVHSVAYDLLVPGKNYSALIQRLESFDSFHAQKSLWFVNVNATPVDLREDLKQFVDGNDKLFVSQLFKNCWAAWNMMPAGEWLMARGL